MIVVTGSLAFDLILDFPGNFSEHILPEKLHTLNVSFLVEKMQKGFGGTAGNISYNLAMLGIKVGILGLVGSDFETYRDFLQKNNVNTNYIRQVPNFFTSTAVGITDGKDNQIWGFYTGADSLSEGLSLDTITEEIDFGIVAPHNPRAMIKMTQEYQRKKIPYLFDPGMQLPWLDKNDLRIGIKGARIVIANDYEMSVIEKKIGEKLEDPHKIIIVTLGEKGSRISYKGAVYEIPPAKVKGAYDPTGAGDAYRAGFVSGFLRKFPIETCGKMGALCAAYTVEAYGTTTHTFTFEEFSYRYKDNFHEALILDA